MTYKPQNPSPKLAPNYGEGWDDEQDERLRVLALNGYSRKEAAGIMGRTFMSIKGRSQTLGLRFTRDNYGGLIRPYDIALPAEDRKRLEDSSARLVKAVAMSIYRGDHLPEAIR